MAGQTGIRAGKAFVELYANDDKLVRGLRSAQRKLKAFGATVTKIGKQLAFAGVVIAAPLALSLKIGADFADQMSKVKAVTAGTAQEFEVLNQKAKELGRTTSFTARQVAEGMVGLGRAGFDRKEIDQSIASILDLARATDTEMPLATDIAGASLRQFNLDASQMGRVVDVLAQTANGSAQILEDLGESMKYVAPLAVEAGESIEQTAAALGVMANNGIKGSMAGTSLARAYKNLASGTTEKAMQAIGVAVADASGNMRPMIDILKDIGAATANMGSKERLAIFEDLFGRGLAANIKLAKDGLKFDDMFEKIQNSAGYASNAAKEMDNNLGGAFRMFMSALEGVAIAIKDALDEPVRAALKSVTAFLVTMAEWIEKNQGIVKAIAAVGAVLLVAGGALVAFGAIISVASFAMGALATAMAVLTSPITAVVALVVSAGIAIAALVALLMKYSNAVKSFGSLILSVMKLFVTYLTSGVFSLAAELLWATLKTIWMNGIADLNKTWNLLKEAWTGVTDDFVGKWKRAIGEVKDEWNGFKDDVNNPDGKAVKASEGKITVSSLTPEELKKELAGPTTAPDPAAKAAQDKADELAKKLGEVSVNSPAISAARTGGCTPGSLRDVIGFINQSTENKTISAIKTTNTLLAEAILQIKKNHIPTTEAG